MHYSQQDLSQFKNLLIIQFFFEKLLKTPMTDF